MRNQLVVNEDRINELPNDLILHILSLLPTKTVISTSVLSKRWRSLWEMVHKLEFDCHNQDIPKFLENVASFWLSYKAPVLESFHLKVRGTPSPRYRCDRMDIGLLLARHLRELELNLSLDATFRLKISLFTSNTLETLKLRGSVLVDVPSTICIKSLRTLHLLYVTYKDDDSVRDLLSSFPNLEHLVVHQRNHNGVVNFNIVAPSLKTLSIIGRNGETLNGGYVINAPSLKYLNIKRLKGYKFCLIENASELLEANISNVSDIEANEMILGSLKSVKRLSLSLSPLKVKRPTGVIFCQLVHLEMATHIRAWFDLLTLMLDRSPKLQVLKLIDMRPLSFNEQHMLYGWRGSWKRPKYVPECFLSHLETFVWTRFDWESEEEGEVALYIVTYARRLMRATFSTRPVESEKRCKMLRELDALNGYSNSSCPLVFESE